MNGIHLVKISVGAEHYCGLDANGAAYCWDGSDFGETGYQSHDPLPVQPVPTPLRFVDLDAGSAVTCGLTASGEIWCWGWNRHGALGQGVDQLPNQQNWSAEPLLVTGGHQWKALDVGRHLGVCAIDSTNVVFCWGHNDLYQLGRGPLAQSLPDVAPITGDYTATQVDVGVANACALSTDGSPICWGRYWPGTFPTVVNGAPPLKLVTVEQLSACGLALQGEAYCWGFGDSLTVGRRRSASGFVDPAPLPGGIQFTHLGLAENERFCGLAKSGRIHCWGKELPWPGFPDAPPPEFGGSEHTFVDLDAAFGTCALTSTGRVFCWFR